KPPSNTLRICCNTILNVRIFGFYVPEVATVCGFVLQKSISAGNYLRLALKRWDFLKGKESLVPLRGRVSRSFCLKQFLMWEHWEHDSPVCWFPSLLFSLESPSSEYYFSQAS